MRLIDMLGFGLGLCCACILEEAAALTPVVEQMVVTAGVAGHTTYRCYLRFDAEDIGRKQNVYTICNDTSHHPRRNWPAT